MRGLFEAHFSSARTLLIMTAATSLVLRTKGPSRRSKSGLDRRKQYCITEGLEQEAHNSAFERPRPRGPIRLSGDKDDRNLLISELQFSLEINSGHARHRDVQNRTFGPIHAIGGEKFFRRRKGTSFEAKLS
jgi:hypothetical protein